MNPQMICFFLLTCKRYARRPLLLLLLLAMPLSALLLSRTGDADDADGLRVAYCLFSDDSDVAATAATHSPSRTADTVAVRPYASPQPDASVLAAALEASESQYRFVRYDDAAAVSDAVLAGEAECGYLIPTDCLSRLLSGEKYGLVTLIVSPQTTMATVLNETVYAAIFSCVAPEALQQYLWERSTIRNDLAIRYRPSDVRALYDRIHLSGTTFSIRYENQSGYTTARRGSLLLSPLRGLLAVATLLCGFLGLAAYYRAAEHPLFARPHVRVVMVLVPLLYAGLSAGLSLSLLQLTDSATQLHDATASASISSLQPQASLADTAAFAATSLHLLAYLLLCLVFLLLLGRILRSVTALYAFFPLYLLGCVFFSGAFLDLGTYVPALHYLSPLFLPYWF